MIIIRLAYGVAYFIVSIVFVVVTIYQPIDWYTQIEQNEFIIKHHARNDFGLPLGRDLMPPDFHAEIQAGRKKYFEELERQTPLIPTGPQYASFCLTAIVAILLIYTIVYRYKRNLRAITDYQLKNQKIKTFISLFPSIVGYGFGMLFIVGNILIRRCWENPNCEASKLVIPLVLSLFFLGITVLVIEATFWRRNLMKKSRQV